MGCSADTPPKSADLVDVVEIVLSVLVPVAASLSPPEVPADRPRSGVAGSGSEAVAVDVVVAPPAAGLSPKNASRFNILAPVLLTGKSETK